MLKKNLKVKNGEEDVDKLHIDIETFSSLPIKTVGVHKYASSPDFKIQLLGYAFNDDKVKCIDLEQGEEVPGEVIEGLISPEVLKLAHNANFEIVCLQKYFPIFYKQWNCTMVKSYSLGLPGKLEKLLEIIDAPIKKLDNKGVHFFSKPTSAGKIRGPSTHPEKWAEYKKYNMVDVEAERYVDSWMDENGCQVNWKLWHLDHKINQTGVKIDKKFCISITNIENNHKQEQMQKARLLTGLDNPNSLVQLKGWMASKAVVTDSLNAESVEELLNNSSVPDEVKEVLRIRQKTGHTSTAKFSAMLNHEIGGCIYGLMKFYGAHTGRWSSNAIQVHNLPRMYIDDRTIEIVKSLVYKGIDPRLFYDNNILKQMIRPAILSDSEFVVADFSAIEARVLCWLAGEEWANKVFATHGKIYEAQAASMYYVEIEEVDDDLRQKGKRATLSLGYQGGTQALFNMGFDGTEEEAEDIKVRYREANKNIVKFWYWLNNSVIKVIKEGGFISGYRLIISRDNNFLKIQLPNKRTLRYYKPHIRQNDWGKDTPAYWGYLNDPKKPKIWASITTFGGRLTENIVQAIARDILAIALWRVKDHGKIIFHVHDEIIMEDIELEKLIGIMEQPISWADGLVLKAAGYVSKYFKKD
jgi:DNA polymerase